MKHLLTVLISLIIVTGLAVLPAAAGSSLTLTRSEGISVSVSMAALKELPSTEFHTSTLWTDGVQKFTGVSFAVLLDTYGLDADTLRISALNDYSVMVPSKVLREDGAILAYHLNDGEMSVREKGPFWVMFPYDRDPRLQTDTYWSYSVWQVKSVDGQD